MSESVTDISFGIVIENRIYSNFDPLRRAQRVTHLGGIVEDTTYACCGVEAQVDREGVVTTMIYDAMGRRVAENRLNVITTNVLDAAGNVLATRRIGSDGSALTMVSSQYNLAGEMILQTNALGGVTQFAEAMNGNGELVRTTTYPDRYQNRNA